MVQYSHHSYKFQFCKIKNFIKMFSKGDREKTIVFFFANFKKGGDHVWTLTISITEKRKDLIS